jgi:hypothetical protein
LQVPGWLLTAAQYANTLLIIEAAFVRKQPPTGNSKQAIRDTISPVHRNKAIKLIVCKNVSKQKLALYIAHSSLYELNISLFFSSLNTVYPTVYWIIRNKPLQTKFLHINRRYVLVGHVEEKLLSTKSNNIKRNITVLIVLTVYTEMGATSDLSIKTVRKVKINKTKIKLPLISA